MIKKRDLLDYIIEIKREINEIKRILKPEECLDTRYFYEQYSRLVNDLCDELGHTEFSKLRRKFKNLEYLHEKSIKTSDK